MRIFSVPHIILLGRQEAKVLVHPAGIFPYRNSPPFRFAIVVRDVLFAVAHKIPRPWLAVPQGCGTWLRLGQVCEKVKQFTFSTLSAALEEVRTLYNARDPELMETLSIIDELVRTYGLSLDQETGG